MTRKEIRQIIDKGWHDRRAAQKERDKKNSEWTRQWTLREIENKNLKRWKHFLQSSLNKKTE